MKKISAKELFRKKSFIAIFTAVCAVLLAAIIAMSILLPYKDAARSEEIWSKYMEFTVEDDTVIIDKVPGKDFKVLNFADTQFNTTSDLSKSSVLYKTMKKCVDEVKPDLITLSGDNAWGWNTRQCVKKLIKVMDSFEIPWAPVYGNHDREGNASLDYLGNMYAEGKYCLFRKGPFNIGGVGNYVISVRENGKIIHSIIMMDSGDGSDYKVNEEDSTKGYSVEGEEITIGRTYHTLTPGQVEWYKWVVEGLARQNEGNPVETSAIFHIPLIQYWLAYQAWKESGFDPAMGAGEMGEDPGSAFIDTGLFEAMQEYESTKNVIVGHDHVNDASILYEGIRLSYALKTGDECYWKEDGSMNGGLVLTINSDGVGTVSQHYVSDFIKK